MAWVMVNSRTQPQVPRNPRSAGIRWSNKRLQCRFAYGHVFPIGLAHLKWIVAVVENSGRDLPELVIAECRDLLAQIAE